LCSFEKGIGWVLEKLKLKDLKMKPSHPDSSGLKFSPGVADKNIEKKSRL
jgi:hypothetical protein